MSKWLLLYFKLNETNMTKPFSSVRRRRSLSKVTIYDTFERLCCCRIRDSTVESLDPLGKMNSALVG